MKFKTSIFLLLFITLTAMSPENNWHTKESSSYTLHYSFNDKAFSKAYCKLIDVGIHNVRSFFHTPYKNKFDVFIYPDRRTLDSAWARDWSIPDFKSECWMVASGVAKKIDILSPQIWTKESCEHAYADKIKTQQLITHELVHVYHGQCNASPDFSDVEGIDWFVEGLATYASGQCDPARIKEVQKGIAEKTIPATLDKFWTGNLKYGLSGSVVMYIDKKYGREKINALLPFNKKKQILDALGITEEELLKGWREFMNR